MSSAVPAVNDLLDIRDIDNDVLPVGKLKELDLSYNDFPSIPECISLQYHIESINVEGNEIMHLGPEFASLQRLHTLNFSQVKK